MNKSNLSNNNNSRRSNENNRNNNYFRCASVEEKNNRFKVSSDLEKEFLDVTYLVKNSVEKINTLFNNKEFKQKTYSKKYYNNLAQKININRCDLNKELDENTYSKNNTLKSSMNTTQKDKNISKYSVNEEDEYIFSNNDLYEELKDLNSNKNRKNNNNKNKLSSKNNIYENDLINNSLLNLESNKLYHKDQNINLKKVTISENTNTSQKYKDKKYKNPSNYVKTENRVDFKKKDILKYVQKGNNKYAKNKQNKFDFSKLRNTNKPKMTNERYQAEENNNKFSKTLKNKNLNGSLQKESISVKKNNSNNMLIDINYNINGDTNLSNLSNIKNNNNDKKTQREDNKLILSSGKHLYKVQKKAISKNEDGITNDDNTNRKKKCCGGKIKNNNQNSEKSTKRSQGKIKIQEYMKTVLLLNEYLINNNLFEDYSNSDNKEMIDHFSKFLANNIKTDYTFNDNNIEKDKMVNAALKIQRKWRKNKFDDYLKINFIEENNELKMMCVNDIIQKMKTKNNSIKEIFDDIINNYNIIYNNIEGVDKIFYLIQKIIQRKLSTDEKNYLYKYYIDNIISKK